MKKTAILIMLLYFSIFSNPAIAGQGSEQFAPHDKFSRGAYNFLTFYFEFPKTIYETSKEKGLITGLFYGATIGIVKSAFRLGAGAIELLTFPTPPYTPLLNEMPFFEK